MTRKPACLASWIANIPTAVAPPDTKYYDHQHELPFDHSPREHLGLGDESLVQQLSADRRSGGLRTAGSAGDLVGSGPLLLSQTGGEEVKTTRQRAGTMVDITQLPRFTLRHHAFSTHQASRCDHWMFRAKVSGSSFRSRAAGSRMDCLRDRA